MRFRKLPPALQAFIIVQMLAAAPFAWALVRTPPRPDLSLGLLVIAAGVASTWRIQLSALNGKQSVSIAVICLAWLLHGSSGAILTAATGALTAHLVKPDGPPWRLRRNRAPLYRHVFNVAHCGAVAGLASLSGEGLVRLLQPSPVMRLAALTAFICVYFLLNTAGIATAIALDERSSPLAAWRAHYSWTFPGYFACAAIAGLFWAALRLLGPAALLLVPLLYAVHLAYRQYVTLLTEQRKANRELLQLKAELEEASRRKDEFLAMLGHELRNPLAAINSAHFLMERQLPTEGPFRRQYEIIGRQAQHLKRLVDDLLETSRITQGKLELRREPIDLVEALERATRTVRALLDARQHELRLFAAGEPLLVDADPTRIEQVFVNLITNAAKYSEPGGSITISTARTGAMVEVRVRDTGVGIAPELLPHIFDLFVQDARSLDRSQGGLGIGLTLVKQLVELHGGVVAAESAGVGQGSEFVVWLPLRAEPVPAGSPAALVSSCAAALPDPAPRRVLVVDDVHDSADCIAEVMREWGYVAEPAYAGPTALQAAAERRPDLVLLDLGLPGMDGYAVARILRERYGAQIRILALTGYGQPEDRERTRQAGFDGHFVKPLDFAALQAYLETAASRQPVHVA